MNVPAIKNTFYIVLACILIAQSLAIHDLYRQMIKSEELRFQVDKNNTDTVHSIVEIIHGHSEMIKLLADRVQKLADQAVKQRESEELTTQMEKNNFKLIDGHSELIKILQDRFHGLTDRTQ